MNKVAMSIRELEAVVERDKPVNKPNIKAAEFNVIQGIGAMIAKMYNAYHVLDVIHLNDIVVVLYVEEGS